MKSRQKNNIIFKILLVTMVAMLILVSAFWLVACNAGGSDIDPSGGESTGQNTEQNSGDKYTAENYTLTLIGLGESDIVIPRQEIVDLYNNGQGVDLDPVYASDKTGSDGQKVLRSASGVYLDTLLDIYAPDTNLADFGSIKLHAVDKHDPVLSQSQYVPERGGSQILIALKVDGRDINGKGSSGFLRSVLHNQANGTWAKQLIEIEFKKGATVVPEPTTAYFVENIPNVFSDHYCEFAKEDDGEMFKFKGISLMRLKDANIFEDISITDEMIVSAWDFESYSGKAGDWKKKSNPSSYNVFMSAYLVYEELNDGVWVADDSAPVFDGTELSNGLKLSNFTSLSVHKTALVCAENMIIRFSGEECNLKTFVYDINMWNSAKSYVLTDVNGTTHTLTSDEMQSATVAKQNEKYVVQHGEHTIELLKIEF